MASNLAILTITTPLKICCNKAKGTSFALTHSEFLSSKSLTTLKNLSLNTHFRRPTSLKCSRGPSIFAVQSNFLKVFQTAWRIGKDGIDAGASLVPDSVPRPIARISVTIVASTVALFIVKSLLSMVFFALGTMGLAYFIFLALNKDQSPGPNGDATSSTRTTTSDDDALEEAKRIMDKYK